MNDSCAKDTTEHAVELGAQGVTIVGGQWSRQRHQDPPPGRLGPVRRAGIDEPRDAGLPEPLGGLDRRDDLAVIVALDAGHFQHVCVVAQAPLWRRNGAKGGELE